MQTKASCRIAHGGSWQLSHPKFDVLRFPKMAVNGKCIVKP